MFGLSVLSSVGYYIRSSGNLETNRFLYFRLVIAVHFMKYSLVLFFALAIFWLTLSGYFNGFLLTMGTLSCLLVLWISKRMGILDNEGVPMQIAGISLLMYLVWLVKQIVTSNISVIKIIISKQPLIRRAVFQVSASPETAVGRVLMANSITLTPGTVTTSIQSDSMQVHALVDPGLNDPTILEIERRVRMLEGR
jgi:multicomponent Na+:H+ antiporter subunit E